MRDYKAKDVDSFIAHSAVESRQHLTKLREIIKLTVPDANESISWGVPFYKYHGLLAGFVALKHHVDFGLAFALDDKDREILEKKGYKTGKKTVQIRFEQKVPDKEIKQILKMRAKMNEMKARK